MSGFFLGSPIGDSHLRDQMQKVIDEQGLPDVVFHVLFCFGYTNIGIEKCERLQKSISKSIHQVRSYWSALQWKGSAYNGFHPVFLPGSKVRQDKMPSRIPESAPMTFEVLSGRELSTVPLMENEKEKPPSVSFWMMTSI